MRRVLPSLVAAALVLAACTGTEPDDGPTELFTVSPTETADPSPTTAAPTTSEPTGSADPTPAEASTEIDVSVIPDEITLDYATAVVNTLYATYAQEALVPVLEAEVNPLGAIPEESNDAVIAIADGDARQDFLDELEAYASGVFDRDRLRTTARISGIEVIPELLQYSSSDCMIMVGRIDRSGVQLDGDISPELSAWSLAANEESRPGNPTAWVVRDNLRNANSRGEPNDDSFMLASTLEDYGDLLQNACEETDRVVR